MLKLISYGARLEVADTGAMIPSPWDLVEWRDVIELGDGRKELGAAHAELTAPGYDHEPVDPHIEYR